MHLSTQQRKNPSRNNDRFAGHTQPIEKARSELLIGRIAVPTHRNAVLVLATTNKLDLFNERYNIARANRERNLWGFVELTFPTLGGDSYTLSASKPLTTPIDIRSTTWKKFRGHLVVVGLSFLNDKRLTIDIDEQKLLVE